MDPVSQGVLGAALPQAVLRRQNLKRIAWIGALSGMAPDLDVLIRSSTDPILFLEFHRQFTHSLIFIPLGALICAAFFFLFVRHSMRFREVYLISLLGYATHGLLDACTTYGTLLLWPFSDVRVAWNNVSVVDPLFTLPVLVLVVLAAVRRNQAFARWAMVWVFAYLGFGVIQSHRAEAAGQLLAQQRGHDAARIDAKPGFGNLFLWKIVYEHDGRFYVDAVRTGLDTRVFEGDSVVKLAPEVHLPWLAEHTQQADDLRRFNWFSNDYLAVDKDDPLLIVDVRYSMLPNEIRGLWGIRLDPSASDGEHVDYVTRRDGASDRLTRLMDMLFGG